MTRQTWSEVLICRENASAVRALQKLARALGRIGLPVGPMPLFIHGHPGCGKSLLAQTLVNQITALPTGPTVQILPASEWSHDRFAVRDDESAQESFSSDVLIVEDLQHLGSRVAASFVHILDQRSTCRQPTILTASVSPAELNLPNRLMNRLVAGLVIPIEPYGVASRRSFAEQYAAAKGLKLAEAMLQSLVAENAGGGLRRLKGAIDQLRHLEAQARQPATPVNVDDQYRHETAEADPIDRILQLVATKFHIRPKEIMGVSRERSIILPRQIVMYVARQITPLSFPQIAARFGKDHTTVMHACQKVEAKMESDSALKQSIREILSLLQ